MLSFLFAITLLTICDDAPDYGDRVAKLPIQIAKRLAEAHTPTESGAIGRNKRAYFHVRFQLGMHHVADYGLALRRRDIVQRFLTAVEYSLEQQLPAGDYRLVIPESLKNQGAPSVADRASGVAFFASSLGLGIHALETNRWFIESSDFADDRRRLKAIKPRLQKTLTYLLEHQDDLKAADAKAPNRLLFDALAFETFGRILENEEAREVAASFVAKAIEQVHEEDGYFIEGGGFDSSYNAVATALTLRLLMIGYSRHELHPICTNAVRWQQGRILKSGEVSTEGNQRVRPGKSGETFLGKEKDVDVGHVVESFMLASTLSDESLNSVALSVARFYENKRRQSK